MYNIKIGDCVYVANHYNNMKKVHIITFALLMGLMACQKKDETTPNNNNTPVKKSKLELLCQTWILEETFEDGVQKTSGGTGKYEFTRQGKFKFFTNGTWNDLGTYDFPNKDSASIGVVFGSSTTIWTLKTLDEKNLKAEFMSGSKRLNYNYKR
jgi:hypothetical protein